jgi:hypothetical protein
MQGRSYRMWMMYYTKLYIFKGMGVVVMNGLMNEFDLGG